jgi:putative transposase
MHELAYVDLSHRTVFAMLLDAGRYLASVSTYRLLRTASVTHGRRNELTHPAYAKPELLASGITKLKGPAKWVCFHLYVILDLFSRYVVGWMIAPRESAELAHELIAAHLRPSSMRSARGVEVVRSHPPAERSLGPHISHDGPYLGCRGNSKWRSMKPSHCEARKAC